MAIIFIEGFESGSLRDWGRDKPPPEPALTPRQRRILELRKRAGLLLCEFCGKARGRDGICPACYREWIEPFARSVSESVDAAAIEELLRGGGR
jgi:hypothetical protein